MMNNVLDQSFLDDMNDAFMAESASMGSYGNVIDTLSEQVATREGLFESEAAKKRRNWYAGILEMDENRDLSDDDEENDDDYEDADIRAFLGDDI